MGLHPGTQILLWCVLVASMQGMRAPSLWLAGGLALTLAALLSSHKLLQLLRRTRWIMLSLWLIYAWTTPGEAMWDWGLAPTREGLQEGFEQMMRLLAALAGLAVLLTRLHRMQLMAGLFALFWPLQWLGWSRERVAVRLALTLHYAEIAMLRTQSWQAVLQGLRPERLREEAMDQTIVLPVLSYSLLDGLGLVGMGLMLWWGMR